MIHCFPCVLLMSCVSDLCAATGVLSLDPCEPAEAEISNQEYVVKLAPIVFWHYFNAAQKEDWAASPVLAALMQKLDPLMKEVVDAAGVLWILAALRQVLGWRTCKLSDILPMDPSPSDNTQDELANLREIEILVSEGTPCKALSDRLTCSSSYVWQKVTGWHFTKARM